MDKKKVLYKFLNENDLVEKFENNAKITSECFALHMVTSGMGYKKDDYTFDKFLSCVTLSNLEESIKSSFAWSKTCEGYDFWLEVDNKWLEFLKGGIQNNEN